MLFQLYKLYTIERSEQKMMVNWKEFWWKRIFYILKYYKKPHLQELRERIKLFLYPVSLMRLETNTFLVKAASWASCGFCFAFLYS
jgi:hypothetical protein